MTQEEKARAYDEALERARELIYKEGLVEGSCPNREVCETIFPELRESEDERIRKKIIKIIRMVGGPHCDVYLSEEGQAECLAYLEKQKSVEWSEEDEAVMEDLYKFITSGFIIDHIHETRRIPWEKTVKKLRTIKYKSHHLQPKRKWSKEDEEMVNSIINVVCGVGSQPNGLREKQVNWLKSLRPSWKPSEEQMKALRRTVNKLAKSYVADSVKLSIMYDNLKKLM